MDLGLMCLSLCEHNRMLQKMMRKMMTVFVVNYVLTHPKCTRSIENPVMEQQTCGKGLKLGFECLPKHKTLHCGRTAGKEFPYTPLA